MIMQKQDLTYLSWSKIRNSSGTAGSFLKSYSDLGGKKIYYKLSNYDAYRGIVGHECVNEIIVDRLLNILGVSHLHYNLIYADVLVDTTIYTTHVCSSEDFKENGESKIALDTFYQAEKMEDESPLDFCKRFGWEEYVYEMLVVDFLILNRDRHGANMEVLRNSKRRSYRLAPLFDHGLSLLFQCTTEEEVSRVDVLEDKKVQCFVGGSSSLENLNIIPQQKLPVLNSLKESDKEVLFIDLENVISEALRDKIWDMIFLRWQCYEDFCNQRRK